MRTIRTLGYGVAIKLSVKRNALAHTQAVVEDGLLIARTLGNRGAVRHAHVGDIVVDALTHTVGGVVDRVLTSGALGDRSAVEGFVAGGHVVLGVA